MNQATFREGWVNQLQHASLLFVVCVWSGAMALGGCGPANAGDQNFWAPYDGVTELGGGGGASGSGALGSSSSSSGAGAGGNGSGGGGGGGAVPSPIPKGLVFRYTTVSMGGKYAPKNIGAAWVTNAQGVFVKTLELRAAKRVKHLVAWRAASGSNIVDAVTGATRKNHGAYEVHWNATDVAGNVVPEGTYQLHVEFTEWNSSESGEAPGPLVSFSFSRSGMLQEMDVPDQPGFTAMHWVYEP